MQQEKSLALRESLSKQARVNISGIFLALGVCVGLALIFYLSFWGMLVTCPAGVVVYKNYLLKKGNRHKDRCLKESRDALLAVQSGLKTGYALENAIIYAEEELYRLWGEDSQLLPSWKKMHQRMKMKLSVGEAFVMLAVETGLSELKELAELLGSAKRGGGGMVELLEVFIGQMEEKIEVETEIKGRLTEKRMEKNIMLIMPPSIILYMLISSYNWVAMLYETIEGRIFMTGCLLLYSLAWWLGEKYLNIVV